MLSPTGLGPRLVGWSIGQLVDVLGRLVVWSAGRSAGLPMDWMDGQLVGFLVSWVVDIFLHPEGDSRVQSQL